MMISTSDKGEASVPSSTVNANSDKIAVTQLLSLFLDRYEGIRELKQEMTQMAKLTNFKPLDVNVLNGMNAENTTVTRVSISYF